MLLDVCVCVIIPCKYAGWRDYERITVGDRKGQLRNEWVMMDPDDNFVMQQDHFVQYCRSFGLSILAIEGQQIEVNEPVFIYELGIHIVSDPLSRVNPR